MDTIIKHIDYDYNGYCVIFKRLCEKYSFLKPFTIGRTVLGRDIKALQLGNSNDCVLYTAAIHGSERITATVLLRFIEELCDAVQNGIKLSDVDVRRALRGKGIIFVPLCNPDGCEIALKGAVACKDKAGWVQRLCNGDFAHWNANMRGVDLNHNFDAGWLKLRELEQKMGYYGPGPTRYGGTRPFSEPETVALMSLCETATVRHCIAFHSQGEVIYWDYNEIPTLRGRKMAEIFAASSGYALDIPTGIATGGGFKDWFIERFRRPGFTVEMGRGRNPLPPEEGAEIYENLREMMVLGLLM